MSRPAATFPYSTDGVEIAQKDATSLPANARGFIGIGLDGSTMRFHIVDASGRQIFVGAGVAGTPAGGVLSIQGVSGGTALPISVAALPLPTGAATEATLATRLAESTFTARINTQGQKAMTASTPIVIASDQSAVAVKGTDASGVAPTTNPVLAAGWDGTNVRTIRTLSDGTVQTRYKELATFTVVASATVIGNNKSMLSIVNASGSTVVLRILAIHIVNVQTTAVTGVAGTFELRRCVNHSVGTAITAIEEMDTANSLSGSVTVRTGATIATESANLLWSTKFSTDDWGPGTLDTESHDHAFQTFFPIWVKKDADAQPITLRANEGLTVKFATNSTAGSFDILVVFAQE